VGVGDWQSMKDNFFEFANEQVLEERWWPAFLDSWSLQRCNDTKMLHQLKSFFFFHFIVTYIVYGSYTVYTPPLAMGRKDTQQQKKKRKATWVSYSRLLEGGGGVWSWRANNGFSLLLPGKEVSSVTVPWLGRDDDNAWFMLGCGCKSKGYEIFESRAGVWHPALVQTNLRVDRSALLARWSGQGVRVKCDVNLLFPFSTSRLWSESCMALQT
jgi:hypothetical protein